MSYPFEVGQFAYSYDQIIDTPVGQVALMADVYIMGDMVELKELSFYPIGREHLRLGTAKIREIYRQIEAELKAIGYKKIRITGHRVTGASPGRGIHLERRLR